MKKGNNTHSIPFKGVILLGISLLFASLVFAGPNEDAGIVFDLDPAYGNQNLTQIDSQPAGEYIKVGVYCTGVHNLDTYSFEVEYNSDKLTYITATATSSEYEPNILTTDGGTAVNWMVDNATPGTVSCSYTLTGQDTTQAPEGEGLLGEIVFQAQSDDNSYMSFGYVYYLDSYAVGDEITSSEIAYIGGVAPMPPTFLFSSTDEYQPDAICLTWVDPTENTNGTPLTDLAGINVYFTDDTYITSVDPGVETYVVQGLTVGETYGFYVTAYDSETPSNESIHSDTTAAMVLAPKPPSDLTAYSDCSTPHSIDLTWTDPTEYINGDTLTNFNHIDIYYSDGTFIAEVDQGIEEYTDTGLTNGQLYSYYLIAVADNQNTSEPTDTVSWYAGGSSIPSPPAGLRVDAKPGDLILLTWDDPTTNEDGTPLDDLAGINIYINGTFNTSQYPGVGAYSFSDLVHGEYYSFYVTAYDSETPVKESQPSRTVECYNQTLLYVQPGSALDSIQVALNICTDDDTILVAAGTYYENLQWPDYRVRYSYTGAWSSSDPNCYDYADGVKLVSESGPEVTIIDAGNHGRGIGISGNVYPENFPGELDTTTVIEGFTIQNGELYIASGGSVISGAGITTGEPITIKGNIITNNVVKTDEYDFDYGAIYIHGTNPVIVDNVITNTTGHGISVKGIYEDADSEIIFKDNTITENSDCGILIDPWLESEEPEATITGNTVTHNGSHGISGADGDIENNIITDNGGYGVHNKATTTIGVDVTDCIITDNASGGIYYMNSTITGCEIENNGGDGIVCSYTTIISCTIYNNQGDGVYHVGECFIHYCDIYGNTDYGVLNSGSYETDAENNWWGDASGPGGAGPGTGDAVSTNVDYDPWSTDPYIFHFISIQDYTSGDPGSTVTVPIQTSDITGDEVTSAEFSLQYDSSIITATGLDDSGTLVSGTDWSLQYNVVDDTIYVEMSGTDVLAGSGTLINLVFDVAQDAQLGQESDLHFCEFIYNTGDLNVVTGDGIFVVGEIYGALEGTVSGAGKSPIQDAVVTAYGDPYTYCDTTDADGYYCMPEVFYGLYEISVTAYGYNDYNATGIVVLGGDPTEVNIQMTQPEMSVSPGNITIGLSQNTTYTTQITISNTGTGPLDYTCNITDDLVEKSLRLGDAGTDDLTAGKDDTIPENLGRGDAIWSVQPNQYDLISPLSPKFEEDVIHYDGDSESGLGLTSGGTLESAIRLTSTELTPYEGWKLTAVQFCHHEYEEIEGNIEIYRAGTSSEPGTLICSDPFSVTDATWLRTDLSEMVSLDVTQDLWVSVEILDTEAGTHPMGLDAGPAVEGKGDFVNDGSGWIELYSDADIDKNLNVRAIVALCWISAPKTGTVPAGDSLVIDVEFDTNEIDAGIYTTNIVFTSEPDVGTITVPVILTVQVGVDDDPDIKTTHLHSNFPNPVGGTTTFSFCLKERSHVELSVYNIRGQLVETLLDEELSPTDYCDIEWDCTVNNKRIPSGIYFYKLKTDSYDEVKKMLIVK